MLEKKEKACITGCVQASIRIALWSVRRWVGGTVEKPHRKFELNFEGKVGLVWEKEGKEKRMDFFNTYSSVKRPSLFSGGLWGARCPAGCWQNELSLENAAMESFNKKERSDRESSRNRGEALKICLP